MTFIFSDLGIKDPLVVDALREIELELTNLRENYTPLDSVGVFGRLSDSQTWTGSQNIDGPVDFAALRLASSQHIELHGGSCRYSGRLMSSLADDATATVTTSDGRPYGIFIMTSNSGLSAGEHVFMGQFSLGRLSTIFAGSLIDNGDNSNNDIDGDVNIWMSNATTISLKNRSGSTLGFSFYIFHG